MKKTSLPTLVYSAGMTVLLVDLRGMTFDYDRGHHP